MNTINIILWILVIICGFLSTRYWKENSYSIPIGVPIVGTLIAGLSATNAIIYITDGIIAMWAITGFTCLFILFTIISYKMIGICSIFYSTAIGIICWLTRTWLTTGDWIPLTISILIFFVGLIPGYLYRTRGDIPPLL